MQAPPLRSSPNRSGGWIGALTSTDHKRIGLNLAVASFAFFLVGGVFALIMRSQLASPNGHVVSDNTYSELFTMHGSTMIYLFVTPMAIALAMYLVPLQIGAASISAPRAALTGFWIWLGGGIIMQSGWFTGDGAGRDGWFAYVPLSNSSNTPGVGQDLWVMGVILAVLGMLVMAACVVATIARRRAPSMALLRMPVFTWTALVTVLMVVAAFPALIAAMGLLFIDRTTGAHIYTGFSGAIDYQDLFWFFGHPVVYVMFFPYLG
ncbi:MAG TPA: cbb3-type cytochrome c oxidase subunit I, partial [Solirubrobacteraceae bacterium]|nr:cbb3-type cytochrome c oxidase subunit I [Solirubrobacteraceae bacterium]